MHQKGAPADPNAINFPNVGSIGTVKPRGPIYGSKNTLEAHVNGNYTDSDFVSWSTSVEANWKLFGPTLPAHDGMFMQLRVKLAELKNTIYDSRKTSDFKQELEITIKGDVPNVEQIK